MMQEAFAATANSRNLLSLGSPHSVIVSDISKKIASSLNSFRANDFSSKEIYLSNFVCNKTSLNSLYVSRLAKTFPFLKALSNAFPGMEYLNIKALKLSLYFRRRFVPFFSSGLIHFNYYPFHNFQFYRSLKFTIIYEVKRFNNVYNLNQFLC